MLFVAIAFAQVSIHSRAKGHSALAASSYRTGTRLYDVRTGITYDYSKRHDIIFSEILLPEGSSLDYENREFLWNQVELAENRCDAQICKDIVLALPKELNKPQQIELTQQFAMSYFVNHGLPADIALHDHGDGNPHAHILTTTRRLEKNKFSRYKARDLNPAFANKFIVEKEYWGERWRDFQNQYFIDHQLHLSVDLNHMISERHAGRLRGNEQSYLAEENQLIKSARKELALSNPEVFINKIMQTHSVFTRRDIERLVFKTFDKTDHINNYLNLVATVLEHKSIVCLSKNERGIDSYTTHEHYRQEGKLLGQVEHLYTRHNHVYNASLSALSQRYELNDEQVEALKYIANGSDISVLIGRPGVGKSYLLKPLKEYYEANHCKVLGASLSGKVAKALQTETGIPSSTIASLIYRLKHQQVTLTKEHVVIIDEAGMVDFKNMAYLMDSVNKAGAKIILVGDPDQLKPINKGEIFRGIAARIGYIELEQIKRQRDLEDRKASLALAHGQVHEAINHYLSKGAIHFADEQDEATTLLINQWQQGKSPEALKQHVILAFTRASVESLNLKARAAMQQQGIVNQESFEYYSQNGSNKIMLAEGERILFRQNDKQLGVRNGEIATITAINANTFNAQLDSGERVIIPKAYTSIDYGYALTVHKAQGMTCEHASVFIDSPYWDKNLAFVAMTRHKESLTLYASKHYHADLDALTKNLSRSTVKDNVIDWPLDFAMRAGFNPDSLIGRAINTMTRTAQNIKDKWNYIVNYEAYLLTQKLKLKGSEGQSTRSIAQQVAMVLDEAMDLRKEFNAVDKECMQQGIKQAQHPKFNALYQRSLERDQCAAQIIKEQQGGVEQIAYASKNWTTLKAYAQRYERYELINTMSKLSAQRVIPEYLATKMMQLDLKKEEHHISFIAEKHGKTSAELRSQIKQVQHHHLENSWKSLSNIYPILTQYEELTLKANQSKSHSNKNLHQELHQVATHIMKDKILLNTLKQKLPKVAQKIQERAQHHQHEQVHILS
jgi:Ti-type conjugative transfer relaxase TraA